MLATATIPFIVISNHEFCEVCEDAITGHKLLRATKSFLPGDVLSLFHAGETLSTPTYLTVQTGDDVHITLQPGHLQYINHSCDPNVFFDTAAFQLVALKPIAAGEEFGFFYPSTEWDMAQPFACHCGEAACLKEIKGAAHLTDEEVKRYRLTNYINGKLKEKKNTPEVDKSITEDVFGEDFGD
jgi:SET domain